MGCFFGCFGSQKNHKRRKPRARRTNPQIQRNRVQDVHHETVSISGETIIEAPSNTLVAEFRNKPMEGEKQSPSPRKRVAFSSNITTYEHVSVGESIESLVECNQDVGIENHSDLKITNPVHSLLEANSSDIPTVGSFPPNHRYHNARESDDEADVYGDSDLENLDEDEHIDYEPLLASSMELKKENYAINEEVESRVTLKIQPPNSPIDGIDHIDYVVNSIGNVSQSKAVDASLSYWLDSPDTMIKKTRMSTSLLDDCSLKNFEDRPILGALTVEEVRQISATSTPRKSPNRSPDEIPIIGTVGTFWSHSVSSTGSNSASPYRGLPNMTSKYREDMGVDWHSTPFETRLDRALDLGSSEA